MQIKRIALGGIIMTVDHAVSFWEDNMNALDKR